MPKEFNLTKRLSPKILDPDELIPALAILVEGGHPQLAVDHAKKQISTLLSFLVGVYHSGRLEDKLGELLHLSQIAAFICPTAENYSNLIYLLNKFKQRDLALAIWAQSAKMIAEAGKDEQTANLWYNYGCVLSELTRNKEAAEVFRRARDINPNCPMTHCQLANVLMSLGEYEEGLREDQWRFKAMSGLAKFRKRFPAPDWDGQRIERVLVFSEQGAGDAIHCSRYLMPLKAMGCDVILEIQNELVDLFKAQEFVDEVYGRKGTDFESKVVPDEAYDSVVSINSLPYFFDKDMSQPAMGKYLNVKLSYSLRDYKRPRIGLVWAGNGMAAHDQLRSCYLKDLAPIFEVPDVVLLNLQKGSMTRCWCKDSGIINETDTDYDVVNLVEDADHLLAKMPNVVEDCKSFYDTAILLNQLDLLITVDTAVAHLAGALKVPTWLLLSKCHPWYWTKEWYTSVKYYKQGKDDNWVTLAARIATDLRQEYSGQRD